MDADLLKFLQSHSKLYLIVWYSSKLFLIVFVKPPLHLCVVDNVEFCILLSIMASHLVVFINIFILTLNKTCFMFRLIDIYVTNNPFVISNQIADLTFSVLCYVYCSSFMCSIVYCTFRSTILLLNISLSLCMFLYFITTAWTLATFSFMNASRLNYCTTHSYCSTSSTLMLPMYLLMMPINGTLSNVWLKTIMIKRWFPHCV